MDDATNASSVIAPISSRTRSSFAKTGVVAGSVWETRMKMDEVKGGIKVFNAEQSANPSPSPSKAKKRTAGAGTGLSDAVAGNSANSVVSGKRKTGKPEISEGSKRERVQPVVQDKKGKRGNNVPVVGDDRKGPGPIRRSRSEGITAGSSEKSADSSPLRKSKSECVRMEDRTEGDLGSVELRKGRFETGENLAAEGNVATDGKEEGQIECGLADEDNDVVLDDKAVVNESEFSEEEVEEEEEEEEEQEDEELKEETETESEVEKKGLEIKEIVVFEGKAESEEKNKKIVDENNANPTPRTEPKPNNGCNKEPPTVVKQSRVYRNVANPPSPTKNLSSNSHARRSAVYQNYAKSSSYESHDFSDGQHKLQNLVDLIMWRDVSKSAFVFGLGSFTIMSSSYTRELNISCISIVSYMGLVYLATIFLYRSLVRRGDVGVDDRRCVVGEGEAIWVLRLVLPYLNEFLVKLKSLFSGDPATTMKLAVLLFVLARCGSSITIWNLSKLGFFGVFVVPKLCSSYSSHITAYGAFWVRRIRDAWNSCSHKKAVAGAVFTLVWNLCSVVARIWAVFMLYVAFRYYQQHLMEGTEDVVVEEVGHGQQGPNQGYGPRNGKKAS